LVASAVYSSKASIGVVKRIPSGYLHMGSRFHPREQRHIVYVAEFEMAQAPVTVSQYAAFLNSEAVKQQHWWSQEGWIWLQGKPTAQKIACGWGRENRWQPDAWEIQSQFPYHPATGITWYEATAYCNWVASETKRAVRLPTEDEWEWAARGEDDNPFPWGELFDPGHTNTLETDLDGLVDVASIDGDQSPFGVSEMAGNVQEWTDSPYTILPGEVFADSNLRVVRGGSFNDTAYGSRTSYRRAYPPGYFFGFLGFRVVVTIR
jgi:formylglycine-generating enzyme required for sulfatase activity